MLTPEKCLVCGEEYTYPQSPECPHTVGRLLTVKDLVEYHQEKYPHMYRGNDDDWRDMQLSNLTSAFNDGYLRLNREAQDAKTAKLVKQFILSDPTIVEIDPSARLPRNPHVRPEGVYIPPGIVKEVAWERQIYSNAQRDMVEAGYVKKRVKK